MMHSSFLRGTDFSLIYQGQEIPHAQFFAGFNVTERVGMLTDRFEGLGAVALLMAYVTAFYDRYRASGADFFAYPDFYTFQETGPPADYAMFDIWPNHKNVLLGTDRNERARAITDRAISILLVPEGRTNPAPLDPVVMASAVRTIRRCILYSAAGHLPNGNLTVSCQQAELVDWADSVLDSVPRRSDDSGRTFWEKALVSGQVFRQTFREISLDKALAAL